MATFHPRIFLFLFQLFVSTIQFKISDRHSHGDTTRLIEEFISTIPDCEIILVSSDKVAVSLNFSQISRTSSGVFQASTLANVTFQRNRDTHRLSSGQLVSVGIFCLGSFLKQISSWIFSTFLPNTDPILQKDNDYFIFLTPSDEFSSKILLTESFGAKLKYKVAIVPDTHQIFNINLFQGLLGEPLLTSYRLGQNDTSLKLFPPFPTQLNGKIFKFSVPNVAFRFEIRLHPDGRYHPVRGPYKWYFEEIRQKFNFSYDMVISSFGGGTGKQLPNGTWVGALGDILHGKADISTMIGLVYSRHRYIGWSSTLSYEWMVFVTPSPKKSYSPMAIFWPFEKEMWLMFWLALMIMTVSFRIIGGFDQSNAHFTWTIASSFEYIYVTFLEQDRNSRVNVSSLKMLTTFWLLFAMVTATAYRGKLVSLIAFPLNTWIPVNFEELANSDFKVALNLVGKAGAAYAWVVSSPNPVIRKLANRVEYIREGEKCLERAIHEDLGCILWKGVADYVMVKNLTDKNGRAPLVESEETAMFIKDGWNFEKRAIFGHIFDNSIQAAVQMGLFIKWFQMDQYFVHKERLHWTQQTNQSETNFAEDSGPKELILGQFIGLFVVFFIGIFIAILQFIREKTFLTRRDYFKCCIAAIVVPVPIKI